MLLRILSLVLSTTLLLACSSTPSVEVVSSNYEQSSSSTEEALSFDEPRVGRDSAKLILASYNMDERQFVHRLESARDASLAIARVKYLESLADSVPRIDALIDSKSEGYYHYGSLLVREGLCVIGFIVDLLADNIKNCEGIKKSDKIQFILRKLKKKLTRRSVSRSPWLLKPTIQT